MKKILIYCVLSFIIILSGCSTMSVNSNNSKETKINIENYDQVKTGMDYFQVIAILGPGQNESEVKDPNLKITTASYRWMNKDGSNIGIIFQNDKVYAKAQALLTHGTKTDLTKPTGNNNVEGNVDVLPKELKIGNTAIKLNKVENDKDSFRVYVTYINKSEKDIKILEVYNRFLYDDKMVFFTLDFNILKHFKKNEKTPYIKIPELIKAKGEEDSILFFPPQEKVSKIDIILYLDGDNYKFNNVKVDTK